MTTKRQGLEKWTPIKTNKKMRVDPRNQLNELTAREWTYFIRSTILTTYPHEYGHDLRKQHYANKPPSLCKEFIEFFTKSGQQVLDPFMGVGGTLIGASLSDRQAIGIEVNEKWIEIYSQVCKKFNLPKQRVILGDCTVELNQFPSEYFDFVLTDPPYFYISTERTSSDKAKLVKSFSADDRDIGNISDYKEFLDAIEKVSVEIFRVLKKGKYVAFFMKNRYVKGRFHPISYDIAKRMEEVGFIWRGEHIWFNKGRRLYPFGYPYQYVVNTVHHNIEVLKKPK